MRVLGLMLCVLALSSLAHAGERLRIARLDATQSPTVNLYLDDLDSEGGVMAGRAREAFKLILDGSKPVAATGVQTARELKLPVDIVMVAQLNATMAEALDELRHGIRALAEDLPPGSRMALVGYGTDKQRLTESLGAPSDAASAASTMTIDSEAVELHLLDSVRYGLGLLESAPPPSPHEPARRKLVVVFSDGVDIDMEPTAFDSLGTRALTAHVVVATIGYAPFEGRTLKPLATLARKARGTARTAASARQIAPRFSALIDELNGQYVVTFNVARADADGKTHSFQATVDPDHPVYSDEMTTALPKPTYVDRETRLRGLWICALVSLAIVLAVVGIIIARRARATPAPAVVDAAEEVAPAAAPYVASAVARKTMALAAGGSDDSSPFPVGWLVGTSGRELDRTFKIDGARAVIGAGPECEVRLDDDSISARHCEVRLYDGRFRLFDLGATNGVFVNGKRAREHELIDNDVVILGRCQLKFKCVE
jgi:hypothetical protein